MNGLASGKIWPTFYRYDPLVVALFASPFLKAAGKIKSLFLDQQIIVKTYVKKTDSK